MSEKSPPPSDPIQLKVITNVHPHDVFSGRGHKNSAKVHPGNVHFRNMVRKYRFEYINSSTTGKPKLVESIVRAIIDKDPPGRFLKQDEATGHWYDMGYRQAFIKTRQALRDDAAYATASAAKQKHDENVVTPPLDADARRSSRKRIVTNRFVMETSADYVASSGGQDPVLSKSNQEVRNAKGAPSSSNSVGTESGKSCLGDATSPSGTDDPPGEHQASKQEHIENTRTQPLNVDVRRSSRKRIVTNRFVMETSADYVASNGGRQDPVLSKSNQEVRNTKGAPSSSNSVGTESEKPCLDDATSPSGTDDPPGEHQASKQEHIENTRTPPLNVDVRRSSRKRIVTNRFVMETSADYVASIGGQDPVFSKSNQIGNAKDSSSTSNSAGSESEKPHPDDAASSSGIDDPPGEHQASKQEHIENTRTQPLNVDVRRSSRKRIITNRLVTETSADYIARICVQNSVRSKSNQIGSTKDSSSSSNSVGSESEKPHPDDATSSSGTDDPPAGQARKHKYIEKITIPSHVLFLGPSRKRTMTKLPVEKGLDDTPRANGKPIAEKYKPKVKIVKEELLESTEGDSIMKEASESIFDSAVQVASDNSDDDSFQEKMERSDDDNAEFSPEGGAGCTRLTWLQSKRERSPESGSSTARKRTRLARYQKVDVTRSHGIMSERDNDRKNPDDEASQSSSYKKRKHRSKGGKTCPICGKVFTTVINLAYHIEHRVCQRPNKIAKSTGIGCPILERGEKFVTTFGVVKVLGDKRIPDDYGKTRITKEIKYAKVVYNNKRESLAVMRKKLNLETMKLSRERRAALLQLYNDRYGQGQENRNVQVDAETYAKKIFQLYCPSSTAKELLTNDDDTKINNLVQKPLQPIPDLGPHPAFPADCYPGRIVECVLVKDERKRVTGADEVVFGRWNRTDSARALVEKFQRKSRGKMKDDSESSDECSDDCSDDCSDGNQDDKVAHGMKVFIRREDLIHRYNAESPVYSCTFCGKDFRSRFGCKYHMEQKICIWKRKKLEEERQSRLKAVEASLNVAMSPPPSLSPSGQVTRRRVRVERSDDDDDDDDEINEQEHEDMEIDQEEEDDELTPREKRRLQRRREKARKVFEKERIDVLQHIPKRDRNEFRSLGFVKWKEDFFPCLLLGPYDTRPGGVRDQWMKMYENMLQNGAPMSKLVFWYGTPKDNLSHGFSFIAKSKFISYEEGQRRKLDQIPPRIQKKIDAGKKLTARDTLLVEGLKALKEDAKVSPEQRSPWLFDYEEDYDDYLDQIDDETSDEDTEQDDHDDRHHGRKMRRERDMRREHDGDPDDELELSLHHTEVAGDKKKVKKKRKQARPRQRVTPQAQIDAARDLGGDCEKDHKKREWGTAKIKEVGDDGVDVKMENECNTEDGHQAGFLLGRPASPSSAPSPPAKGFSLQQVCVVQ